MLLMFQVSAVYLNIWSARLTNGAFLPEAETSSFAMRTFQFFDYA